MATIAQINVRIGAIIKPLEQGLQKAERKLQRSGRRMANIGSTLTQAISLPILGIGAAALKSAGDFEALENGLIAIMGDATAAKKELEELRKVALKPGLNLTQAVKGSVRLQAVGLNAEKARRLLAGMGNSIALVGGTAVNLEIVNTQLSQMVGNGKILGQEIRTLKEQIPQASAILKDAFGTSTAEGLRADGVSVEQLTDALITGLEKLPPATSGIKNSIANIGAGITEFLSDIGMEINKAFNFGGEGGLAEKFTAKLQAISAAFRGLDDSTKKTILKIAGFAAAIGPVFFVLGKVKLALAAIAGAIRTVFSLGTLKSLLNPWTLAFAAIIAAAILIVKNWDVVKTALVNVINSVIQLYNSNVQLRISIEAIKLAFKALWKIAKSILTNIGTAVNSLFRSIMKAFSGDFSGAAAELKKGLSGITNNIKETGADIGRDFADSIAQAAKGRLEFVSEDIFSSLENAGSKFTGLLGGVLDDDTKKRPKGKRRATAGIEDIDLKEDGTKSAITALVDGLQQARIASDGLDESTRSYIEKIGKLPILAVGFDVLTTKAEEYKIKLQELLNAQNKIIESGIRDAVFGIAEAFGAAIAAGGSFGQILGAIGTSVLNTLAGVLGQLGKMIIAAGLAVDALKKAILSPFGPGGLLAVAAGFALIAISKAIPALIGGSGGVPGFAGGTNFAPGGLALVGERGPELINSKRGSQIIPNHMLGGGGQNINVVGKIKGNDILLITEKAQKIKNRIR